MLETKETLLVYLPGPGHDNAVGRTDPVASEPLISYIVCRERTRVDSTYHDGSCLGLGRKAGIAAMLGQ